MKRWLRFLSFAVLSIALLACTALVSGADGLQNPEGGLEQEFDFKLNFVDTYGNALASLGCKIDVEPDVSGINASVFDSVSGKVNKVDGWYWKLDGENESLLRALSADEISALGSKEITVYPKTSEQIIDTFAIYVTDSFGVKRLVGKPSDYASLTSIKSAVGKSPDGAVVVLLYDKDIPYEIGGGTVISIPRDKNVSFDLNGRTLVHSYKSTYGYGYQLFSVNEGTTFNFYSTQPGGAIFQAKYYSGDVSQAYASGVISIASEVDAATVNVGSIYDGEGRLLVDCAKDFSIYGGSLVMVNSSSNPDALRGNGVININVDGGYYYHALRSGYAIFTMRTPDVYINLKNAVFHNVNTTYSIFHDYQDTASNVYKTESYIEAYNCEFICRNADNTQYTKLFFSMGSNSTAYFEDCLIIGAIGGVKGKITFGGGNVISGNFLENKNASLAENVSLANHNGVKAERKLTYPPLFNLMTSQIPPIVCDEAGDYRINPEVLDRNNWIYDALVGAEISAVTCEAGKDFNHVKPVEWFDLKNNSVAVEYWAVGSKLIHNASNIYAMSWYGIECKWQTESGNDATEYTVSGDSENKIYAVSDRVTGYISGKLANLTLYNDMVFNLYLPINPSVENVSVTSSVGSSVFEKTKIDGVDMYVIRWRMPLGDFEGTDITVKYIVSSTEIIEISEPVELEYTVSINLLSYLSNLYDDMKCGSQLSVLMYSAMSYQLAAAKHRDERFTIDSVDGLSEFYDFYHNSDVHIEGECTCMLLENKNLISEAEYDVGYKELEKNGVKSINFVPDDNGLLNLVVELSDKNVALSRVTAENSKKETITFELEFSDDKKTVVVKNISAANINCVFTFAIEQNNGSAVTEITGQYCLGRSIDDYIYFNFETYEESTVFPLMNALYRYSYAARSYKLSLQK